MIATHIWQTAKICHPKKTVGCQMAFRGVWGSPGCSRRPPKKRQLGVKWLFGGSGGHPDAPADPPKKTVGCQMAFQKSGSQTALEFIRGKPKLESKWGPSSKVYVYIYTRIYIHTPTHVYINITIDIHIYMNMNIYMYYIVHTV